MAQIESIVLLAFQFYRVFLSCYAVRIPSDVARILDLFDHKAGQRIHATFVGNVLLESAWLTEDHDRISSFVLQLLGVVWSSYRITRDVATKKIFTLVLSHAPCSLPSSVLKSYWDQIIAFDVSTSFASGYQSPHHFRFRSCSWTYSRFS